MKRLRTSAAFTLLEVICATAVTTMVLAGAAAGIVALQKSFVGSRQYSIGMNDGSRLTDYVARDLRNAVKVSRLDLGTATAFKLGSMEVTADNQLVIFVPDYYVSNVPDNSSGSTYKSPRYSTGQLPSGQTYFTYANVVEIVGVTRLPRYPANLEIRYLKKARSTQDPTICFFRQEYSGGALTSERDIAEKADVETLIVTAAAPRAFQILTSFVPKWSRLDSQKVGTQQYSSVHLLNKRRD